MKKMEAFVAYLQLAQITFFKIFGFIFCHIFPDCHLISCGIIYFFIAANLFDDYHRAALFS